MLKAYSGVAIALEDYAALEVVGDQYKIVTGTDTAQAYKVYWKRGLFYEELLEKSDSYRSLSDLLSK